MRKMLHKLSAAVLTVALAVPLFVGCNRVVEDVDKGKSQLYVANYTGGVGAQWIEDVKVRFEEAYKDVSFEDGKKGVQIFTDSSKSYDGQTIESTFATDSNDVMFTNNVRMFNLAAAGSLMDLTELVKNVEGSDGKTIESKLSEEQKENITYNGKYYAIPHAEFYNCFPYDAGVFKLKNLYFGTEIDTDGTRKFVMSANDEKSCGPNGVKGDYDDGLPSSYQEFYKLMDKMTKNNVKPFVFTGKSSHYTNILTSALFCSYVGADGISINYNYESDSPLEIVTGFDGDTPVTEIKDSISRNEAYLLRSSAGLYYALELGNKVFSSDAYYYSGSTSTTYTHLDAMLSFMKSGLDGEDYIAMLIDGSYWYNEASEDGIFDDLKENYPRTYTQKDIKTMPLPWKYEGTVLEGEGKVPTMVDFANSFCFVKAGIEDYKKDLAFAFLSFCYTDDELCKFTQATNILKAVNYDFSNIEGLSSYTQSILDMRADSKENGTFTFIYSNDNVFLQNQAFFGINSSSIYWNTDIVGAKKYAGVYSATRGGQTAKNIFLGMAITEDTWLNQYLNV